TGDSGMKSNLDRLALAVSRAVATTSGKEDPDVIGKFQQEFVEAIRTDVYAEGIKEKRDTLAAFIKSQVIGELEPLIQTPYLGRNSATRLASMPARVPASSGRPGPGDPPKERDGQGKGPGHKARHD